ncbi:MAG: hypothetical protein KC502_09300 [Myxococcales bacterium]|nr:hypothetical protein [Myxococcales bacterium]
MSFYAGKVVAIVPCSREKAWHTAPDLGPLPARLAYTSPLHHAAVAYAQHHADEWLVLSALHGLLRPDDEVPGDYDVTFSREDDPVISPQRLSEQARDLGLQAADQIVILCPDDYADRLATAMGQPANRRPLAGIALDRLDLMTRRLQELSAAPT